jgi:hypothetical protein
MVHLNLRVYCYIKLLRIITNADKIKNFYNKRYSNFPMRQLRAALKRYSPLRLIRQKETGAGLKPGPVDSLVETGESRTPSYR